MEFRIVSENKKQFLDLLLLADEQEDMIDLYLDRGTLFVLYDDGPKCTAVVTQEDDNTYELQSLATQPAYQGRGYGGAMVRHVCAYYAGAGRTMLLGTGDCPGILRFYEGCGFVFSHRIPNYFLEHYREPIFEDGKQLIDKVYLKQEL